MINKERFDLEISKTYVDAPLKIGLLPSFLIYLFGAIKLLTALSNTNGDEGGRPYMFPILFLMIFLAPALYNRKKSIFEKMRKPIKTFTGGGSVGFAQGTMPFLRLLVYDDAIEVRFFFHSYLIPYNKMEEAPNTVGTLFRGLSIRSNLPGVPKKIVFVGLGSDDIAAIIGSYRLKQDDTHERRVNEPGDGISGISNIIVDESTKQKKITSQIKRFAIKTVLIVFLAEIIAISGFGIIYGNLMIMNNKNKQNVKIFKNREYKSISTRAPVKFETVIVEYDSAGAVKKETFINVLGDTTIIRYKNGTSAGESWTGYSNIVMIAFPVLGMLLMILSELLGASIFRKRRDGSPGELTLADKLQICGIIMFFSVFIIGPIKIFLIDFLI